MQTVDHLATTSPIDRDTPTVLLVDLDSADAAGAHTIRRAADVLERFPGVAIGIARDRLSQASRDLAGVCATSFLRTDSDPVGVQVPDPVGAATALAARVRACPSAASILGQLLRSGTALPTQQALWVESTAYSTLLGGQEFRAWRAATPTRPDPDPRGRRVVVDRRDGVLDVTLDRPQRGNALDAAARQQLTEAFDLAVADPSLAVQLSGAGASFCTGGDLDEFGAATDLAAAHRIRTVWGPAMSLAAAADRTTVHVHGPCVGAGVELAAFGRHVVARPGTTFRLPELGMGLLPGSGGTVSLPRRIGRWRTAWLALTGATIGADLAQQWGLVDEVA